MSRLRGPFAACGRGIRKNHRFVRFDMATYTAEITDDGVAFCCDGVPVSWSEHDYFNVLNAYLVHLQYRAVGELLYAPSPS